MTDCIAIKKYEELCSAYGRSTAANDLFHRLIKRYINNNTLTELYNTGEEVSYEFKDGSTINLYYPNDNKFNVKAEITNGIEAGIEFDTMLIDGN